MTGTAEAGSTVKIYTNSSCSGAPDASGSAATFSSPGIAVSAVANDSSTTYYASATDAASNVSSCSSGVTYVEDSTAPSAPSSLGTSPGSPANNNNPKITGTAEALSTVKLYTNSSCSGGPDASGGAATFSAPGLAVSAVANDSSTTYYATATDAAGNTSSCSTGVTYVEDSTAPSAPSSLATSPGSPANNNNPKITGTAEALSTVKLYTNSSCSGGPDASGSAATFSSPGISASAVANDSTTTYYATATDAASNTSPCSSGVTYLEDSTDPSAVFTFPASGGAYINAAYDAGCPSGLCGTASDVPSGVQNVELSIKRVSDGKYWDGSGFGAGSETYFLTTYAAGNWSYLFTAANFPADGDYTVHARARDNAGNLEAGPSRTFTIDNTAPATPTLAFDSFTNASATGSALYFRPGSNGGFTVTATSSDAQSGIANGTFPALGAGWSGGGTDSSSPYQGVYTFNTSASAPSGNQNVHVTNGAGIDSADEPFTVVADSAAPSTSISCTSGCAGWHPAAPVAITLSAGDGGGSGVQQIKYTTDGSDPTSGGTVYAGPFDVSASATVKFAAYDKVGNVETVQSQSIQIDTTKPSAPGLSIGSFTNAAVNGGIVYFRASAAGSFDVTASSSDAESGVASYTFPSLGSGWSGSQSGVTDTYSFSSSAADPAEPNNVTATNNAGLTSDPTSFTVTADGTAPSSSIACTGGCAGWHTSTPVSITLSSSDGESGVAQLKYTTDGSDPGPLNGTLYVAPFDVSATATVKYAARDAVGNWETANSQLVQVDTTKPSAPSLSYGSFTNAALSGGVVYFRAGAAGSFDVTGSSS
ncbi:MAG: chitobiase/beta-hexosaminidase C-terminal domain-containing protein, partial [Actinomycetota bacterium]|nr:chitobiase/beta-hexosaminidase C-terminal domain-containing protein [Actinomycetota bacterium]